MGIIFSCCRKKQPEAAYKKIEERPTPDIEGGGFGVDDDEEWDDFDAPNNSAAIAVEEPQPEPEPDPFAGFDMAPTINKTKRHNVREVNVFAKPAVPSSSMFAMGAEAPDEGAGGGWGDADLGDDLGVNERRRMAEERREARRKEREAAQGSSPGSREKRSGLKGMALKVNE